MHPNTLLLGVITLFALCAAEGPQILRRQSAILETSIPVETAPPVSSVGTSTPASASAASTTAGSSAASSTTATSGASATLLGTDTTSTQDVSRTSNSVSVQSEASSSSSASIGGAVGGQAGGQGSMAGGEITGAAGENPSATPTAGAVKAMKTIGAGALGLAIGAVGMII